jgi:(p)ppGpp synthase/HD superfamily hydrolase
MNKEKCIDCGSYNVIPTEYGYLKEGSAVKDNVYHGGCVDTGNDWYCKDCELEFSDRQIDDIVDKAKRVAIKLHLGQTRKGGNIPFIVHPEGVVVILKKYTSNKDIISAGWLHDTVEDVIGYSHKQLEKDFGEKIANIVKEVSEDKDPTDSKEKSIETWRERKLLYIENLKNDSFEALMVSCADKIHNMESLMDLHKEKGNNMWEPFNAPEPKVESEIWYYSEVLKVLKKRLKNNIVKEYKKVLKETKNVLS